MNHAMHRAPLSAHPGTRPFAPTRNPLATCHSATSLVLDTIGPIQESDVSNPNFKTAIRLYEEGNWPFAFDRLSALADDHHAAAAKLALLMLRYGRGLYGTGFVARPAQVARWAQCVLRVTSRATASPNSMTASA
jgi:hypothetical protein